MKIWIATITIMLFVAILAAFNTYLDLPVVYWSYSDDKCVKVIIKGIECDCSELPNKYERIWVK